MNPLTDAELESLLGELESDRAERKESWAGEAPEKGGQAVCAFANDLPNHQKPGVLFVGAKDNGIPSNLPITDKLLLTLADLKSNGNIVPPPTLTVEKRMLKGAEVAVVTEHSLSPISNPHCLLANRPDGCKKSFWGHYSRRCGAKPRCNQSFRSHRLEPCRHPSRRRPLFSSRTPKPRPDVSRLAGRLEETPR